MRVSRWAARALLLGLAVTPSCGGDDEPPQPPGAGHGGAAGKAGSAGTQHGGTGGTSGENAGGATESGGGKGGSGEAGGDAGLGASGGGGESGEAGAGTAPVGGTTASGGTGGGSGGSGGTISTGGSDGVSGGGGVSGIGGSGASGGAAGSGAFGSAGTGGGGTCVGAPLDPSCLCIKVETNGDDALAAASGGTVPFANVQAALDFADVHRDAPAKVCVAMGATCSSSATYAGPAGGDLTMRDGISLYGGYESTTWTRCPFFSRTQTKLAPQTERGIYFGSSIQSATTLDGITIVRFVSEVTTALTLDGAVGPEVIGCELGAGALGSNTALGVEALNGADAELREISMTTGNDVIAPNQLAIRSVSSRLVVTGASLDLILSSYAPAQSGVGLWFEDSQGSAVEDSQVRLLTPMGGPIGIGVHAEASAQLSLDGTTIRALDRGAELIDSPGVHWTGGTLDVAYAVGVPAILLDDSPGATIDVAAVAHGPWPRGVVVTGSSSGTSVAGSFTVGVGSWPGVEVHDCGDSGPTITMSVDVPNFNGIGEGIRVSGDCAPTISAAVTVRDLTVSGTFTSTLIGIHCLSPSRCSITGSDVSILGRSTPPGVYVQTLATGILCDEASCPLIEHSNVHGLSNTDGLSHSTYRGGGVSAPGATIIRANRIEALCAGNDGFGLYAPGAQRIENNIITGPTCGGTATNTGVPAKTVGLVGGNDVHSNTIWSGYPMGDTPLGIYSCTGVGLDVAGNSTVRNNIIQGSCYSGSAVRKTGLGYPLAFENNKLVDYRDNGTLLTDDAAINALPGAANNFSSGTVVDRGTTTGAPATDIDGFPRDSHPDVGAHEATECDVAHGGCDPLTTCTGIPGGHLCGPCPSGYTGDGTTGCVDLDECAAPPSPCPTPSVCANDVGGYHCVCPAGYVYNVSLRQCVDYDECNDDNGDCGGATCINTEGGHHCGACLAGYTGTPDTGCQDIDECQDPSSCDPLTSCFNYDGTYGCGPCPPDYTGTGETGCVPVCADNGGCDPLTICIPLGDSSHACGPCPSGYTGSGSTSCQDVDECQTNHGGCDPLAVCTNTPGGRTCGACPPGYSGDGTTGCHDASPMVSLSVATLQACGLRASGSIECWGNPDAYYGTAKPVGETFLSVSAAYMHTCAVRTDGTAVCWGGQQTAATPGGTFSAISAGDGSDCGLHPDGSVECWGFYGAGTMTAPAGPFVAISAGGYDACALRADHSVTCWGANLWGGADALPDAFTTVDTAEFGTCGITTDGELACWGGGDRPGWAVPPPLGTFIAVATGAYGGCAIATDQTLSCWGDNNEGETFPPPGTYRALSFGSLAACAIRSDDAIVCWGDAGSGLLDGPPS